MPRLDRSSIPEDVSPDKPHTLPDGRVVIGFYPPSANCPQGKIKFSRKGDVDKRNLANGGKGRGPGHGSKASKAPKKPVKKRTVAKKRVASNPLFADLDEYEIGRFMQIKRNNKWFVANGFSFPPAAALADDEHLWWYETH